MKATFRKFSGVYASNGTAEDGRQVILCDEKGRLYWPSDKHPEYARIEKEIFKLEGATVEEYWYEQD
jgi:hypothetical protein